MRKLLVLLASACGGFRSAVLRLFAHRRPAHIPGLVVAIVIDALNRMSGRWLRAEHGKELTETGEPELNATTTIIPVATMGRSGAARFCGTVRRIFRRSLPMIMPTSPVDRHLLDAQTPATPADAPLDGFTDDHFYRSAIALSCKPHVAVTRTTDRPKNQPPGKSLAGQILESLHLSPVRIMQYYAILLCLTIPVSPVFAQVRWDIGTPGGSGVVSVSGSGQPFLIAQPGVSLQFCAYPANAVPCSNFSPTFNDLTLSTQCPSNAQIVLQGSSTCQATSDNYGNLGVYTNAGTYQYTLTVGAVSFGPYTLTLGGGGSGPGSTVQGTVNQINASSANPQVVSFANPTSFPGAVTIPGTFTLTGSFQGQGFTSNASGALVQTSAPIYVNAFTTGADPCAKILTGLGLLPSPQNGVVDAHGLGSGSLTPACSAANAHAMFNSATSGNVVLGNYTIWVPLSETAPAVACSAPNATSMCQPPIGVIPMPNKFTGIMGSGRGDAGTSLGTNFGVCKGTNNPVTGCVAPITRESAITATAVSYVANVPYLHITSSGMDFAGGEPVRIRSSLKKDNNGAWRVCNKSLSNSTRTDSNCPANPTSTDVYVVGAPGLTSIAISGSGNGAYTGVCTVSGGTGTNTAVLSATTSGGNIATITITNPGRYTSLPTVSCAGGSGQTFTPTIQSACVISCGIISGGIPVFDFTPLTGNQFAQRIENLSIDCEGIVDCVGIRSLTGNEQSGLRHVKVSGSPERAIDFHQFVGQNADTLESLELYGGTTLGANCDVGTTAAFFGENGPHGLADVTVNFGNCTHTPAYGIVIDTNTYPFEIDKTHCENTEFCYFIGQDSPAQYWHLMNSAGGPISQCGDTTNGNCVPLDGPFQNGQSSVIAISPNYTGSGSPSTKDFSIHTMVKSTGATNIIADWRNQTSGTTDHTSNQNSLEAYIFDNSPTGCNALITTDSGILNVFCFLSTINPMSAPEYDTTGADGTVNGAHRVQSGSASNTDFSGELTMSGGTNTYSFTGTFTSHPECIGTDQTSISAVKVTYTGVASVTFTTSGGSDVVSYVCGGRN